MEYGILVAVVMIAMAGLGGWVASQKNRDATEGFVLGLVFGPLGVLVEALLPNAIKTGQTTTRPDRRSIDQEGQITFIADRFREALEQADPNWPDWYAEYMVREQAGIELPQ